MFILIILINTDNLSLPSSNWPERKLDAVYCPLTLLVLQAVVSHESFQQRPSVCAGTPPAHKGKSVNKFKLSNLSEHLMMRLEPTQTLYDVMKCQ